jgi:hypothetical protein
MHQILIFLTVVNNRGNDAPSSRVFYADWITQKNPDE